MNNMRRKNIAVDLKTIKIKPQLRPVKVERQESHQGAFFFGMVIGVVAGAVAALFMTPKSGSQIRHQLKDQAGGVQQLVTDVTSNVRDRSEGIVGGAVDKVTRIAQRDHHDEVIVVAEDVPSPAERVVVEPSVPVDDADEETVANPS